MRRLARRRVPYFALEYLEGGAEDELALRRNRQVFDEWRFAPPTLVDTSARSTATTLFGQPLALPLIVAPTGLNGLQRRGADLMLARAASAAGIPFCLSTVSNTLPEVIATAGGQPWMQLYVFKDPATTARILERAEAAGFGALMLTTDANVFGGREWHVRTFSAPGRPSLRSVLGTLRHPRWLADVVLPGMPRFENIQEFLPAYAKSARTGVTLMPQLMGPTISWDDVARLRERWPRRLIIKGILTPEDAEKAVRLGCDGIVLTNHGGRQLDASVTPLEVLPQIARTVGDKLTILIDSGFRRGSDIAKAVALGAHAVMVGRPTLYGVAAAGEAGAARVLEILRSEFDRTLGLLGCNTVAELTPKLLVRGTPTAPGDV
jgi:(S)-mandelate dehydrogenase